MSSTARAVAREAANDDVEHGDDAVDDGLEDRTNAVHHGHYAGTDGLEDGLDLEEQRVSVIENEIILAHGSLQWHLRMIRRHPS